MLIAKPQRVKVSEDTEISIGLQCLSIGTNGKWHDVRFGPDGAVVEKEAPKPKEKEAEVRTKVVKEPPVKRAS